MPKQVRGSRLQRVVASTQRDVLVDHVYESVSVAQIAPRACRSARSTRASPARNTSSSTSSATWQEVLIEGETRRAMGRSMVGGTRTRFYVREMAASFAKHRWIMRPATMIARQVRDPELVALLQDTNRRIHGAFRTLVLGRLVEIGHPDPSVAIDVAILMVSAAMREVFLYGNRHSDAALERIAELSSAAAPGRQRHDQNAVARAPAGGSPQSTWWCRPR